MENYPAKTPCFQGFPALVYEGGNTITYPSLFSQNAFNISDFKCCPGSRQKRLPGFSCFLLKLRFGAIAPGRRQKAQSAAASGHFVPKSAGFGEAHQQAFLRPPRGAKIASVYTLALLARLCNPQNSRKNRVSLMARIITSTSRKSFSSIELSITSMRLLHPLAAPLSG